MVKRHYFRKENHSFPLYGSFAEFIDGICAKYGSRPALSWFTRKKELKTYTYRELCDRVRRFGAALGTPEAGRERIAIAAENSAQWLITFLAAVSRGFTVACIDVDQSDDIIRDMVRSACVDTLFVSPQFLPIFRELPAENSVRRIVVFGEAEEDNNIVSWEKVLDSAPEDTERISAKNFVAELVFTSGTTGKPKAVMLEDTAILHNIHDASHNVWLRSSVYTSLPFYHSYGLNSAVLCSMLQGCSIFINGNIRTAIRDLWLSEVETAFAVPLITEAMISQIRQQLDNVDDGAFVNGLMKADPLDRTLRMAFNRKRLEKIHSFAVGQLKLIICGGASLPAETAEKFEILGVQVLQGYGITECSPLISVNCNYANKLGTVGRPLKSAKIRIADGEIWIKGPSVMKGYFNDEEQTAEAFDDGWFKTGDLGYIDRDGFLVLTGRKKSLIVLKNGNKVSPEKLEELVGRIPLVKEVMVYGSANGVSADDVKITASVFPDPEKTAGMEAYEILGRIQNEVERINETLPAYQQIQMVTIRDKELAKTSLQKTRRF